LYPLEELIDNDKNECNSDQFAFISYSKLKDNVSKTVLDLLIHLKYKSNDLKKLKIELNNEQQNTSMFYVINLILYFNSNFFFLDKFISSHRHSVQTCCVMEEKEVTINMTLISKIILKKINNLLKLTNFLYFY
jgi:hypothetical protein